MIFVAFLSYFCKTSILKKSGFYLDFENRAIFGQNDYEVTPPQLTSKVLSVSKTSGSPPKVLMVSKTEQSPLCMLQKVQVSTFQRDRSIKHRDVGFNVQMSTS